jgi:hypothetical protein
MGSGWLPGLLRGPVRLSAPWNFSHLRREIQDALRKPSRCSRYPSLACTGESDGRRSEEQGLCPLCEEEGEVRSEPPG